MSFLVTRKGAFTGADEQHIGLFETASGSTLFLDEIGELPMLLQSTLLRVLQESKIRRVGGTKQISIDVRVIAATNRDLSEVVEAGMFRRDLYERLKPLHILLPALRERRGDISALAIHFLAKALENSTQKIEDINPEILSLFHNYAWPGNIRELEGVINRAVLLAKGPHLTAAPTGNRSEISRSSIRPRFRRFHRFRTFHAALPDRDTLERDREVRHLGNFGAGGRESVKNGGGFGD